MTPKQCLEQVSILEYKIKIKLEQIQELRSKAQNCTQVLSERVQSSPSEGNLANIVAKIADFEHELDCLIDSQIDAKREIIKIIDAMSDKSLMELVDRKYLKGENLVTIAYKMNYSYAHVRRMHSRALKEVKKIMLQNDTQ